MQDYPLLLTGPYHSMERKLHNAQQVFECAGNVIGGYPGIEELLGRYGTAVHESWQAMEVHGVVRECTDCAVNGGGSCCGAGIEDKFDVVILIINLLLGVTLPQQRLDPSGCWFLGEKGCLLVARHVICINYMCRRLYDALDRHGIQSVQQAMGQETDLLFMLEERIKTCLRGILESRSIQA